MQAEAAIASLRAIQDFRPSLNVPLGAYLRMRILGAILTRYRKEWSQSRNPVPGYSSSGLAESHGGQDPGVEGSERELMEKDEICWAMERLKEGDRWLIQQIYWSERTEADIASSLGISQQAISKRKRAILKNLNQMLLNSLDPLSKLGHGS